MELLIQWEMLARHKEVIRTAELRAMWEQDGGVMPQKENVWMNRLGAARKLASHLFQQVLRSNRKKVVHELLR